jgi:hypothetical protein
VPGRRDTASQGVTCSPDGQPLETVERLFVPFNPGSSNPLFRSACGSGVRGLSNERSSLRTFDSEPASRGAGNDVQHYSRVAIIR